MFARWKGTALVGVLVFAAPVVGQLATKRSNPNPSPSGSHSRSSSVSMPGTSAIRPAIWVAGASRVPGSTWPWATPSIAET